MTRSDTNQPRAPHCLLPDSGCAVPLDAVLSLLDEGCLTLDAEGRITYANQAFAALTGYPLEELPGREVADYLPPASRAAFAEGMRQRKRGEPGVYELDVLRADGASLRVAVTAVPVLDNEGVFQCSLALVRSAQGQGQTPSLEELGQRLARAMAHRDLSSAELARARADRAELEEDRRRAESNYKALFDSSPMAAFAWRRKGGTFELVDYNRAALDLTEGGIPEHLGATSDDFFSHAPRILEDMETVFRDHRPRRRELDYHMRTTGRDLYMVYHYAFLEPDLVILHALDISERIKAQERERDERLRVEQQVAERTSDLAAAVDAYEEEIALRVEAQTELTRQQVFLRSIIDLDPSLIFVKDWNGRFILANKAMADMYGATPEELAGRDFAEVHTDREQVRRFRDEDRRVMAAMTEQLNINDAVTDHTGRLRWFRTLKRPIAVSTAHEAMGDDMDRHVLGVSVEVTEQLEAERKLMAERDLLVRVMETSPDGIMVVNADGGVAFANAEAARLLGFDPETARTRLLVSSPWRELDYCTSSDGQPFPAREVLETGRSVHNRAICLKAPKGEERHLLVNAAPLLGDDGGVDRAVCTILDETERKKADEEIRRLSRAVEQSPVTVVITDTDGTIVYVNPKFSEVTGYSEEEATGRNPSILKSGRHDDAFYKEMWETIARGETWRGEMCNKRKDGGEYWELASISAVTDAEGRVLYYVAVKEDITERRRQAERIRQMALHDSLTGLPNRVLFMDRLDQAISRAQRFGAGVALLFVDLDRFKAVNDTHGHRAGDLLLKQVALRLTEAVRAVDTVARLGGDEFVVVLQDILPTNGTRKGPGLNGAAPLVGRAGVNKVATRIIADLSQPFDIGGATARIGASVGIALYPDHGSEAETLLRRADKAMYKAKNRSRGAFHYFEPT